MARRDRHRCYRCYRGEGRYGRDRRAGSDRRHRRDRRDRRYGRDRLAGADRTAGATGSSQSGGRGDFVQLHAAKRHIRRKRDDGRDERLHDHIRRWAFLERPDSHADAHRRFRRQPDLDRGRVLQPELDCELHLRIVPTSHRQLHRQSDQFLTFARVRDPRGPAPLTRTPSGPGRIRTCARRIMSPLL